MRCRKHFTDAKDTEDTTAYTRDGRTWTLGGDLTLVGEDVAFLRGTWKRASRKGHHTIECVDAACWAAGSSGRVGHS